MNLYIVDHTLSRFAYGGQAIPFEWAEDAEELIVPEDVREIAVSCKETSIFGASFFRGRSMESHPMLFRAA